MDLKKKIALVTGGTKGIGAATAILLAKRGADVAINGRHDDDDAREALEAITAAGTRGALVLGDMAKPEDARSAVERTVEELGGIDILVHSAGGGIGGGLSEVSEDDWYHGFDVHVHAIFHLCRAALPLMKEKREGAIVLISSVAGIRGVKTAIAYQAVKGAIPQIARALAYEASADNVRVNCVSPGVIRTAFHKNMPTEVKQNNIDNRIPLHREGTSEQVATSIVELVENDYITGENLVVDGGLTMRIA